MEKYYWFVDDETDEEFAVCSNNKPDAIEIAKAYFDSPRCYGEVDEEEVERSGVDVY